jgi:hypothetical protein
MEANPCRIFQRRRDHRRRRVGQILINAENGCFRVIFTVVGSTASVLAIFLYRL